MLRVSSTFSDQPQGLGGRSGEAQASTLFLADGAALQRGFRRLPVTVCVIIYISCLIGLRIFSSFVQDPSVYGTP